MIRNLVFGQFLMEHEIITHDILHKALDIQKKERDQELKTNPRLLGLILLEEFKIFKNESELNKCLEEFEKFKKYIEEQHAILRND